ncbi:MAG: hypothetical protein WBD50_03400 [Candidatus Rhabdochlamydia sp.]
MDEMEWILNLFGPLILGPFLIEYGLSRWQRRPFSIKKVWLIFVIGFGAGCLLKGKI